MLSSMVVLGAPFNLCSAEFIKFHCVLLIEAWSDECSCRKVLGQRERKHHRVFPVNSKSVILEKFVSLGKLEVVLNCRALCQLPTLGYISDIYVCVCV